MPSETEHKPKLKSTGTTIIGVRTKDAVILAGDQKSTEGYLIASKKSKKVRPVSDRIVYAGAGMVGDIQAIHKFLQAQARTYKLEHGKEITVEQLANYAATILNYNKYSPFLIEVLLAGYSNVPRLYSIDAAGGILEAKDYTASGSGCVFAYGVLEEKYRDDLSLDDAVKLAVRAVRASKERDVFSGGVGIDVLIVTKDGYKEIDSKEVEKYVKA